MSEKPLFDFAKLQELDKQKQGQNEQLNTLLDQNDLIRKKIPDGPNSLLRAISDALYSTTHYADEIKQFLFKHLTHLIASDKLPTRLAMFRGNTMLLKDYTSNPHMSGFDKINIELVSSQFKVKIVVYSISEDGYLSSIIVNNHYERTIEIVRAKNNHYEPVYSKLYMQKLGVAQNIVLNIIEKALNKDSNLPFKNLNEDSYLNFEYLNWLSSLGSDTSLSQFRITRGKHKKSVSDSFGKVFEPTEGNQMKLYGMFTNTKPPEDFLKLLRQRKDTAESNFSINADFDFMDEPWHETPTNPAKTPVPATSSTSTSFRPNANKDSDISSSKATPQTTSGVYFRDNVNFSEEAKNERTPVRDVSGISPVHFMNTPPPGLTPSRYPQKSFTYVEVGGHPGMTAEGLSPSPTFTRPESVQTAGNIYGQATPTRPGFSSGFTQAYKGTSPLPRQGSGLYQNRTGNSETLTLSVQSSEGMMQDGAGFDQGVLSASKEKKKPIILDESKERYTGRLKFFDETKNYGFIIMDGDGSDIFVHMDDLMKANITKDMLKDTKNGIILRLAFSCMKYIGKYQKSRKATDIELLP